MPEPAVESVVSEIERRIKRLRAMVEIAEESLRLEEGRKKVPKPSQGNVWAYLITALIWTLGGVFILYVFRSQYSGVVGGLPTGVPLAVYGVVGIGIVVGLLFYYISRERESGMEFDFDEKARAAKLLIREFYVPLKEALVKGDEDALRALADRLLDDPVLANAMEVAREGDPRLAAYALYLYSSFASGNVARDEVNEAIEIVDNRALRLLLESLLNRGSVS